MSENSKGFTKVTHSREKKTNIVTPNTKHPNRTPRYQSELTAQATLFTEPTKAEDWINIDMGTNNLIKLETLLLERKPFK